MYITGVYPLSGKRSKKVRVTIDDGGCFVLYKREAQRYGLSPDTEITDDTWERLLQEVFVPRARYRAMHLLEKQDRTREGLRKKLREGGYPDEAIAQAVAYVESYHYIDDSRYAASYVRYHQQGKSRRRIEQDLRAKGVSDEDIERAIETEFTVSETDMIKKAMDRRHFDPAHADIKERQRIYRFLLGRGFSYDDINSVFH